MNNRTFSATAHKIENGLKTTLNITTQDPARMKAILENNQEMFNSKKSKAAGATKTPGNRSAVKTPVALPATLKSISPKQLEDKILKLYKHLNEYGKKNHSVAHEISQYCRDQFNKHNLWKLTDRIPITHDEGKETISYRFTDEMLKVLNRSSKFKENLSKAKKYNKILENYYKLRDVLCKDYIALAGEDKFLHELYPKICKIMGW